MKETCPYYKTCRKYPDCPKDFRICSIFNKREALKDMEPVECRPEMIKE